jgi:hypothetical protein
MACLAQSGCQKSEYQPLIHDIHPVLDPHTPDKDREKCTAAERTAAENAARAALIAQCKALDEKVECPGDCSCHGEGAFPTDPKTGAAVWKTIETGLKWAKTFTSPAGCKYKVTMGYDLQYRETPSGKCHKKSPTSPE